MRTRWVCGLLALVVGSLGGLGTACGGSSSSSPTDSGAPPPDGSGDSTVAVDSGGDSSAAVDSSAGDSSANVDSSADAGTDSSWPDAHPPIPDGGYPCFDSGYCDPATQYCLLDTFNGGFAPSCMPLPSGCTMPSCACLVEAGPGQCDCTVVDGGILVHCNQA